MTVYYLDRNPDFDDDEALQNAFGRDADSFCVSFTVGTEGVTNCTGDTTGPSVTEARTDADSSSRIRLTFDKLLLLDYRAQDEFAVADQFVVYVNGTQSSKAPAGFLAGSSGTSLLLNMHGFSAPDGASVRVYYKAGGTATTIEVPLRDVLGNEAADFCVEYEVGAANAGPDFTTCKLAGTRPRVTGAGVDGSIIVLTFDQYLNDRLWALDDDPFTVTRNGTDLNGFESSVTGAEWRIDPDAANFEDGNAVTVLYVDPSGRNDSGVLEDPFGLDVASFCVSFTVGSSGYSSCPVPSSQSVGPQPEPAGPLTAEFVDAPPTHDGAGDITFELRFNQALADGFSDATLQGSETGESAITVSGGTLAGVERIVAGDTRRWRVTVSPASADEDVFIALAPTFDCAAANALCGASGEPLSVGLALAVPATSEATQGSGLTVSYTAAPPAEHDGESAFTFAFGFSENLHAEYSYKTMRDRSLSVVQGPTTQPPMRERPAWTMTATLT